jgi:hypothetical protein
MHSSNLLGDGPKRHRAANKLDKHEIEYLELMVEVIRKVLFLRLRLSATQSIWTSPKPT